MEILVKGRDVGVMKSKCCVFCNREENEYNRRREKQLLI